MGQVTIYVEDGALEAAKRAAERAQVSVSQWFAKFAVEEKNRQAQNWDAFFAEIDRLGKLHGDGDRNDFPSLEEIRAHEVPDSPRESW
jgi:cupin superfamily acireductone dioxygenase involved in methionine salvage